MNAASRRTVAAKRVSQYKVHAPRVPSDPADFSRFVADLNGQLNLISDAFAQLSPNQITPTDYVRKDELNDLIDDQNQEADQAITSEGEGEVEPKARGKKSSRKRARIEDAAAATIQNAIPTVAPPFVGSTSQLGTTTDPTLFSLSDHTHGGVATSAAGAAGQVSFFTSVFEIRGDNALFWDNTNKRLGIGTAVPSTPLHISGNGIQRVRIDAAGNAATTDVPRTQLRRARSTIGAETAVTTGDDLGGFDCHGHDGTNYGNAAASIIGMAAEAFTGAAHGTHLDIYTTALGAISSSFRARMTAAGELLIGTTTAPTGGALFRVSSAFITAIYGSEAASGTLTLRSTTNATLGKILLGATLSAYDEANVRIGIGTQSPVATVHGLQATLDAEVFRLESTATNDDPNYYARQQRVTTTDATLTTIETIALAASNTYMIESRIVARRTGGAAGTAEDAAVYLVTGAYKVVAGVATLVGSLTVFTAEDQAAWNGTHNVSGGNVLVQVQGAVNNNVTWHVTTLIQNVGT